MWSRPKTIQVYCLGKLSNVDKIIGSFPQENEIEIYHTKKAAEKASSEKYCIYPFEAVPEKKSDQIPMPRTIPKSKPYSKENEVEMFQIKKAEEKASKEMSQIMFQIEKAEEKASSELEINSAQKPKPKPKPKPKLNAKPDFVTAVFPLTIAASESDQLKSLNKISRSSILKVTNATVNIKGCFEREKFTSVFPYIQVWNTTRGDDNVKAQSVLTAYCNGGSPYGRSRNHKQEASKLIEQFKKKMSRDQIQGCVECEIINVIPTKSGSDLERIVKYKALNSNSLFKTDYLAALSAIKEMTKNPTEQKVEAHRSKI